MKLHITHIHCNVNDEFDGDEIFLRYKDRKIWPSNLFKGIRTGQTVAVDTSVTVENDSFVSIELWEYDLLTQNDYLGSFEMRINEAGGPFQTSLKLNDQGFMASYMLTWEVRSF